MTNQKAKARDDQRVCEVYSFKYILRAGKKDKDKTVQDLEKAIWYCRRKIALIKGSPPRPNEMPQERM